MIIITNLIMLLLCLVEIFILFFILINRFTLLKKVQIVFRRERILSIICLRLTVPVHIANTFLIRKILGLIIMQVLILVLSMYSVTITLVL